MYGKPVPDSELPHSIDWKSIIRLAKKHVVLGIIIDSVQFLPESLRPTAEIEAKMKKFALGLIQTNLIMDKTAAYLTTFFKSHGINGVLLKGQGVARYYRIPQMRQSGDIDFYVGKEHYKNALKLCKGKLIEDNDSCYECERHFGFNIHGVPIELHRLASRMYSPFRNKRFQKWVKEELENSPNRRTLVIGKTDVVLPSFDFDALYIFYHAWCHYITGGIGLRQLCDWAILLHTYNCNIDAERLQNNIKRFGLLKGWKLFSCIVVKYLGVSKNEVPFYDRSYENKSEKILEEIITGGNFGFFTQTYARTLWRGNFIRTGWGKAIAVTRYFFSLFPVIPVEATFLYFNRLFFGTISFSKRSILKPGDRHRKK